LPSTYVDTLTRLQQRSFDALKVTQAAQLASLAAARELSATLATSQPPFFAAGSAFATMTELTTSFTFALLEQQVAYAKSLTDAFAAASTKVGPTPQTAPDQAADTVAHSASTVPIADAVGASLSEPAEKAIDTVTAAVEPVQTALATVAPNGSPSVAIAETPAPAPPVALETAVPAARVEPPASDTEILSKTLPPAKMPTVSSNRMPPKRGSGKK
jgi:hypothetical protein